VCTCPLAWLEAAVDGPLTVNSIDWGVRRFVALLDSIPNPITVWVEPYSISADLPFLMENLTLLSSTPVVITTADNPVAPALGTWKNTVVNTPFNPGGAGASQLVLILNGQEAPPPPTGACCTPPLCTVTTQIDCTGWWYSGITCTPQPCMAVPTESMSWGQIKSIYR
jgi:hypothetical protein